MKAIVLSLFIALCTPVLCAAATEPAASSSQVSSAKININQADAKALAHSFKGIGKKRAEAIVQYRNEHGPFKSLETLARVHGLGEKFVKAHLVELEAVFAVE
ncbi:ComEA family DNA-binding protein [Legionella londiniensis]|uniref:Competence protein ComEA n=1 Tax=Legionella londiniensis TaxID=45068 RepID=A0A0W0VQI4_9GAMM|nr:helix-hairpin-helix domain-containing protein [Legionella londiniensis]KTD22380.1 competence protein ComEA [Legionella londiniensis]STX93046.1 competence protein ComEA [Legionella londiniensis]